MTTKNEPSTQRVDGNLLGGVVNVGGTQTIHGSISITIKDVSQSVNKLPIAAEESKREIEAQVNTLRQLLAQLHPDRQPDGTRVARRVEDLIEEAGQDAVDREAVEVKASLLRKAADALGDTMPTIVKAVGSIISSVLKAWV